MSRNAMHRLALAVALAAPAVVIPVTPAPAAPATKPEKPEQDLGGLHINVLRNMVRDNPNIPADVKAKRVKMKKVEILGVLGQYASAVKGWTSVTA